MRSTGERLNALLSRAALPVLNEDQTRRFESYVSLLLRWNARVNLTAIRDEDGILQRHFVESIACAAVLPAGIATLLDFGSGAGFPGIPIAICRPEIAVTLAESQGKKAAFLHEAVRVLEVPAQICSRRAETLEGRFDCVVLRAVDRMAEAVSGSAQLVEPGGWLALMTTETEAATLKAAAGPEFLWRSPVQLPGSESRILVIGSRGTEE